MGRGSNAEVPGETADARRALFRNPAFVVPYVAESQSIAGDQVGRVALSILVFDRTGSAAWTAFTYALTYLPAIIGGFVLGGFGDRFPRVWVMVLTDLARAGLFVGVAIPGVPLPIVVSLIAVAFFLGPAFTAAMVSRLAAALVPDQFRSASGARMITAQVAQVGGFALGGLIVALVHPRAALLINAATFAVSALVVGVVLGLQADPRAASDGTAATQVSPPVPKLLREPWLRHLMLLTMLAGFFVVPEGLAVPLTHDLHRSSTVSGLLLAAGPLGSAVGAALLVNVVPRRHGVSFARLMAVGCGLPLLVTALLPPWPVLLACWAVSGALWAYQVDVATAFVHSVDERVRSRTIARASAVLLGAQGIGLTAFGGVGQWLGARWGVGLAGLAGVCTAGAIALSAVRSGVRAPDDVAGPPARHRANTGGRSSRPTVRVSDLQAAQALPFHAEPAATRAGAGEKPMAAVRRGAEARTSTCATPAANSPQDVTAEASNSLTNPLTNR